MAYGIQIKNPDNSLVIDENYYNLVLRQKITGTTVANTGAGIAGSKVSFTWTGSFPIIAWQSSAMMMMYGFTVSGGTFTFLLKCAGAVGSSYTLYVFAEPDNANVYGGYGLDIKNAAGNRVFHSGAKPIRVIDNIGGSAGSAPSGTTVSYTAGREYATCMLKTGCNSFPSPTSPGPPIPPPFIVRYIASCCRGIPGGGGIERGAWQIAQAGPYTGGTSFTPLAQGSEILVVDVTGY